MEMEFGKGFGKGFGNQTPTVNVKIEFDKGRSRFYYL